MKRVWLLPVLALLLSNCKKSSSNDELPKGYFRMIVLDAPQNNGTVGKAQFYWDKKINSNGDSVLHKSDGSIFSQDPSSTASRIASVSVNYPSGGWVDNPKPSVVGVYSFDESFASLYSYFPNATHRVPLAPIIGLTNFYRWAAFDAGSHLLEFRRINRVNSFGSVIEVQGQTLYKNDYALEAGAVQTLFLYNKASAKYYDWENNGRSGFVYFNNNEIYQPGRTISFFNDDYDVVTVKDHPQNLPVFNDSSAYVRFINFTPSYGSQTLNESAQSIDIYLAPLFGPQTNLERGIGIAIDSWPKNRTRVGAEFLVSRNVRRFEPEVDQPFYEIPLGPYMQGDTVGRNRYFRVLAYRSGESAAKGNLPLASNDWLTIYNTFNIYTMGNPNVLAYKSWLLRGSGQNFYPTINTIAVAIGTGANPSSALGAPISQPPLQIRSVIQYTQSGLEKDYQKF